MTRNLPSTYLASTLLHPLQSNVSKVTFTPTSDVWQYRDPRTFLSNGAVYYIAARADEFEGL